MTNWGATRKPQPAKACMVHQTDDGKADPSRRVTRFNEKGNSGVLSGFERADEEGRRLSTRHRGCRRQSLTTEGTDRRFYIRDEKRWARPLTLPSGAWGTTMLIRWTDWGLCHSETGGCNFYDFLVFSFFPSSQVVFRIRIIAPRPPLFCLPHSFFPVFSSETAISPVRKRSSPYET